MQPTPFVIDKQESGAVVASNGQTAVIALDEGASMFLRRGVRGLPGSPVAEKLLPQINLLAGDLLARSNMPASELKARLHILMAACEQPDPQNVECLVVDVKAPARVYVQQGRVIITQQDITV